MKLRHGEGAGQDDGCGDEQIGSIKVDVQAKAQEEQEGQEQNEEGPDDDLVSVKIACDPRKELNPICTPGLNSRWDRWVLPTVKCNGGDDDGEQQVFGGRNFFYDRAGERESQVKLQLQAYCPQGGVGGGGAEHGVGKDPGQIQIGMEQRKGYEKPI